jgi:hypothetical protein
MPPKESNAELLANMLKNGIPFISFEFLAGFIENKPKNKNKIEENFQSCLSLWMQIIIK